MTYAGLALSSPNRVVMTDGGRVSLRTGAALCGFILFLLTPVGASKGAGASIIRSSLSPMPRRTEHGLHLPIFRQTASTTNKGNIRRGGLTANTGLGDFLDVSVITNYVRLVF